MILSYWVLIGFLTLNFLLQPDAQNLFDDLLPIGVLMAGVLW
jgi:hypothetical protein